MDIHHHKPSTILASVRQLRGYRFHLDPQTQKREVNENKRKEGKKKFNSIQITMEEKITYTGVIFSTSLLSFLHESILSSQLHKENKNYMKENKKSKLQTTN